MNDESENSEMREKRGESERRWEEDAEGDVEVLQMYEEKYDNSTTKERERKNPTTTKNSDRNTKREETEEKTDGVRKKRKNNGEL